MSDKRRTAWLVGGAAALLAAGGLLLHRAFEPADSRPSFEVEDDLRDAVASPSVSPAAAARMSLGSPVPVSYFAGPSANHREIDRLLLSRRRARQ